MVFIFDNIVLTLIILFISIVVSKICILNFLNLTKNKYPHIYKELGNPSLAFSDIGRDGTVWLAIMRKDFSKHNDLQALKGVLTISGIVFIIIFLYFTFFRLLSFLS